MVVPHKGEGLRVRTMDRQTLSFSHHLALARGQ
jgi:hypothetical protein